MKKTINVFLVLVVITLTSAKALFAADYPTGPVLAVTPGKLCDHPTKYRYPENIAYCERDVAPETKDMIIAEYDQKLGYRITDFPRADFKIDHLIPLCAGGSNDMINLWPQHKSVYIITDPLEPLICAKMAAGRLKQKDAVSLVIEAKTNLSRVQEIIQYISAL